MLSENQYNLNLELIAAICDGTFSEIMELMNNPETRPFSGTVARDPPAKSLLRLLYNQNLLRSVRYAFIHALLNRASEVDYVFTDWDIGCMQPRMFLSCEDEESTTLFEKFFNYPGIDATRLCISTPYSSVSILYYLIADYRVKELKHLLKMKQIDVNLVCYRGTIIIGFESIRSPIEVLHSTMKDSLGASYRMHGRMIDQMIDLIMRQPGFVMPLSLQNSTCKMWQDFLEKRRLRSASLFCLILGNGQELKLNSTPSEDQKRFFSITSRIPYDVKMVLCNRAFGSMKTFIPHTDIDESMKRLSI